MRHILRESENMPANVGVTIEARSRHDPEHLIAKGSFSQGLQGP